MQPLNAFGSPPNQRAFSCTALHQRLSGSYPAPRLVWISQPCDGEHIERNTPPISHQPLYKANTMNTDILEVNTEELEAIQGGGSTILGNTAPVDPQLQQLHQASAAEFIRNIYP